MDSIVQQKLLVSLLDLLSAHHLKPDPDTYLKISRLFKLKNVQDEKDVLKIKYLLGPLLSKNAEELRLFNQIIDRYRQEEKTNDSGWVRTVLNQIFLKNGTQKSVIQYYKPVFLIVFSIIVIVAVIILTNRKSHRAPSFSLRELVSLRPGQTAHFYNKTPPTDVQNYIWDFGDSATLVSSDSIVIHAFKTEGEFQVSLRARYSSGTDSTAQQTISVQDSCHVMPAFMYSNPLLVRKNEKISTLAKFKNISFGNLSCVNYFLWEFGDSAGKSPPLKTRSDTVQHRFPSYGKYTIKLTAVTCNGKLYTTKQTIRIDSTIQISLSRLGPNSLPSSRKVFIIGASNWLLLIIFCLIPGVIFSPFILKLYRSLQKFVRELASRGFTIRNPETHQINFQYPDQSALIDFSALESPIETLYFKKEIEPNLSIEIYPSIRATIEKAGFAQVVFKKSLDISEYLFLIDLGHGMNQQSLLFEAFIAELKKGIECSKYYYRTSCSSLSVDKDMTEVVTLTNVAKRHRNTMLVIFGDGYGMQGTDEFFRISSIVSQEWEKRYLLTPVPQNLWGKEEKKLSNFISIFPANVEGLRQWTRSMIPSSYRPETTDSNSTTVLHFPVRSDIVEYKKFFAYNPSLLLWVCSLAIAEQPDWNLTLAVGRALEDSKLLGESSRLVTYSHLLEISSLEWMQSGVIGASFRMEMMSALKNDPLGKLLIPIVAKAMLDLSQEVQLEKGSLLAREKEIQETILRQWGKTEIEPAFEFLNQERLLNIFTLNHFGEKIESTRKRNKWEPRILSILLGLSLSLLAFISLPSFLSKKTSENLFFSKSYTDSFAYYNNLACQAMNYIQNKSSIYQANNLFTQAKRFIANEDSNKIRLLENNERILYYLSGKYYFESDSFRLAIVKFSQSATGYDSVAYHSLFGKAVCYYYLRMPDSACQIISVLKFNFWGSNFKKSLFLDFNCNILPGDNIIAGELNGPRKKVFINSIDNLTTGSERGFSTSQETKTFTSDTSAYIVNVPTGNKNGTDTLKNANDSIFLATEIYNKLNNYTNAVHDLISTLEDLLASPTLYKLRSDSSGSVSIKVLETLDTAITNYNINYDFLSDENEQLLLKTGFYRFWSRSNIKQSYDSVVAKILMLHRLRIFPLNTSLIGQINNNLRSKGDSTFVLNLSLRNSVNGSMSKIKLDLSAIESMIRDLNSQMNYYGGRPKS